MAGAMTDVSPEVLRELLRYEPDTGKLFWLERDVDWFTDGKHPAERRANIWNARYAGKEAFTACNSEGYRFGKVLNDPYKSHRVAWAVFRGEWPPEEIDHINGDRGDNRIVNLRAVTRLENHRNKKKPKNNTSGVIGVSFRKRDQKWKAQIMVKGKHLHLGCFANKADAIAARKAAEVKYGFHANHGRAGT